MAHVTADDGTALFYEEAGRGRPLVMIHGWSFSGRFFRNVVPALAQHARIITPDLRGHGRSDKPGHGYNVPRYAADLRDLITALDLHDVTLLGWSLGCPVIWSHLELFGRARVREVVLVEQTPFQLQTASWRKSHVQCFDQASCATMLTQMAADTVRFDESNLAACVQAQLSTEERRFLLDEMSLCPVDVRTATMDDHTVRDWRPLLPHLDVPALVMVAERDGVFPEGGPEWAGEHMPKARTVRFSDSSHMIFHDEPDRFVSSVVGFMEDGHD